MKKMMILWVLLLTVCAMLAGCFNSNEQAPGQTPMPGTIATPGPTAESNVNGMNPAATAVPGTTPGMNSGANGGQNFDWAAQAAAVEARINMFSEIQDCRVVADQGTALVGVKFTSAYQGELTQRIRDMIAGEVMAADNTIQVVAVTAEEQDVNEIFTLADQQRQGTAPADMKQKIDQIARNTTTLR